MQKKSKYPLSKFCKEIFDNLDHSSFEADKLFETADYVYENFRREANEHIKDDNGLLINKTLIKDWYYKRKDKKVKVSKFSDKWRVPDYDRISKEKTRAKLDPLLKNLKGHRDKGGYSLRELGLKQTELVKDILSGKFEDQLKKERKKILNKPVLHGIHKQKYLTLMKRRQECIKSGDKTPSQYETRVSAIYARLSDIDFTHSPEEKTKKEQIESMIKEMPAKMPEFMPRKLSAVLFAKYIMESGLLYYFYRHEGYIRYDDIVKWRADFVSKTKRKEPATPPCPF